MGYSKIGRLGDPCQYCQVSEAAQWDAIPRVKDMRPWIEGQKHAVCRNCWGRVYRALTSGYSLDLQGRYDLIRNKRPIPGVMVMAGFKALYSETNHVIGYESDLHSVTVNVEMMERAVTLINKAQQFDTIDVIDRYLSTNGISGMFKTLLTYYILGLTKRA